MDIEKTWQSDKNRIVVFSCKVCNMPSCFSIPRGSELAKIIEKNNGSHSYFELNPFDISEFVVSADNNDKKIPEYLPMTVLKAFRQAENNANEQGHEEASALMFRRCIEMAARHLDNAKDLTLIKRLEKLKKDTKITPSMFDWANQIRIIGNDAAHDEDPISNEELESIRLFSEMFLRYAFTLPEMINKLRLSTQSKKP